MRLPLLASSLLALVALAGCSGSPQACESTSDCGAGQRCIENRCFVIGECAEACSAHQYCAEGACAPRFSGLRIARPLQNGALGANGLIEAYLDVAADAPPEYPDALAFVVLDAESQHVGSGLLTSTGNGRYTGTFSPPSQAAYRLRVSHESAGLTSEVDFKGDLEKPVVTLEVPVPTRPEANAAVSWIDPEPGFAAAWRRDELPVVTLGSDSPDADPSSFALAVKGIGSEEELLVSASPTTGCGKAHCAQAKLDLAAPPMKAFRGTFVLRGLVKDMAGNEAEVEGAIKVTRWRWNRVLTPRTLNRPVIGHKGATYWETPYFRRLIAVSHDARELWQKDLNANIQDFVVAESGVGGDSLYVLVQTGGGNTNPAIYLFSFRGSDGSSTFLCSWGDRTVGRIVTTQMKLNSDIEPVETLLIPLWQSSSGSFSIGRARTGSPTLCNEKPVATIASANYLTLFPGMAGNTLVALAGEQLVGYRIEADPLGALPLFDIPAPDARGAAFSETHFAGIFSGDSGSTLRWVQLNNGATSTSATVNAPFSVVFNEAGRALVSGDDAGQAKLVQHTPEAPVEDTKTLPGLNLKLVVGSDGTTYATGNDTLTAMSEDLTTLWTANIESIDNVMLDCARDEAGNVLPGRPGTLYGAYRYGQALSVVTDSRGFSTRSPWPVEGRDARGTKNASASLGAHACP